MPFRGVPSWESSKHGHLLLSWGMVAWEVAGRTSESGRVGELRPAPHPLSTLIPLALASQHVTCRTSLLQLERWDGLLRPSALLLP